MSLLLFVLAGVVVQGIVRALVWSQSAPDPSRWDGLDPAVLDGEFQRDPRLVDGAE